MSVQSGGAAVVDREKTVEMRDPEQPQQVWVSHDERDPRGFPPSSSSSAYARALSPLESMNVQSVRSTTTAPGRRCIAATQRRPEARRVEHGELALDCDDGRRPVRGELRLDPCLPPPDVVPSPSDPYAAAASAMVGSSSSRTRPRARRRPAEDRHRPLDEPWVSFCARADARCRWHERYHVPSSADSAPLRQV